MLSYVVSSGYISTRGGKVSLNPFAQPESREYQIQPAVLSTLLGIALLGTVIGQLVFGWFGD